MLVALLKAVFSSIRERMKHKCTYTKEDLKNSVFASQYAKFTNENNEVNELKCCRCGKPYN